MDYAKTDAQTIEYTLDIPAESEKTVEYTVQYVW